jgi:hypothetical protein
VALVRVYCGVAAAEVQPWLTAAVVDDSGRLLDLRHLSDDPAGYAHLTALLAERSATVAAVAIDRGDRMISQLLAAANRPLAIADDAMANDFAGRFSDDTSYDEMRAPHDQRRAVGLARALQAGALYASTQHPTWNMDEFMPVLGAHTAVTAGRQAAAAALRNVLRELYPAALRAYADPADVVPLRILDALPEPSMLSGSPSSRQLESALIAELSASGVADTHHVVAAISALRVAVDESPPVGNRFIGPVIAETVRQAVAAVRACDAASASLVASLVERLSGPANAATMRPYLVNDPPSSPVSPAPRRLPGPGAEVPPSRLAPRGGAASGAAAGLPAGANFTAADFASAAAGGAALTGFPGASAGGAAFTAANPAAGSGQPDSGHRSSAHPGSTHPGSAHPGSAHPGSAHPGSGYAGSGYPGSGDPGSGYPGSGDPGSGYSGSAYPGADGDPAAGPAYPAGRHAGPAIPAPRPAPGYSAPGSRSDWPLVSQPVDEYAAVPQSRGYDDAAATLSFSADPLNAPLEASTPAGQRYQPPQSPARPYAPASPYQSDLASPYQSDLASPYQSDLASPYQSDLASPYQSDLASPYQSDLASPYQSDLASPYQSDPASPYRPDPGSRYGNRHAELNQAPALPAVPSPRAHTPTPHHAASDPENNDPLTGALPGPPQLRLIDGGRGGNANGKSSDGDLLIFSDLPEPTAWFTQAEEQVIAEEPRSWGRLADDGWRAAGQLNHPSVGIETNAGLPRRVPQANLVPGSAQPQRSLRIVRDARSIAAHTEGYFRGWRRGQEIGAFAIGQRDRAAWEFNRDQRARESEYVAHNQRARLS